MSFIWAVDRNLHIVRSKPMELGVRICNQSPWKRTKIDLFIGNRLTQIVKQHFKVAALELHELVFA